MMKKIVAFFGVMMVAWGATFGVIGEKTYACDGFLGFVPWYDGISSDCKNIDTPSGEQGLSRLIWVIVANVAVDLFLAVGYIAVGFVIYGGYLFIMSDGDPGKAAKGRKTLTAAIVGSIIAILASMIIRTILTVLGVS